MVYVLFIVAAQLIPVEAFATREGCHAAADALPREVTPMCVAWVNN